MVSDYIMKIKKIFQTEMINEAWHVRIGQYERGWEWREVWRRCDGGPRTCSPSDGADVGWGRSRLTTFLPVWHRQLSGSDSGWEKVREVKTKLLTSPQSPPHRVITSDQLLRRRASSSMNIIHLIPVDFLQTADNWLSVLAVAKSTLIHETQTEECLNSSPRLAASCLTDKVQ